MSHSKKVTVFDIDLIFPISCSTVIIILMSLNINPGIHVHDMANCLFLMM